MLRGDLKRVGKLTDIQTFTKKDLDAARRLAHTLELFMELTGSENVERCYKAICILDLP